MDLTIRQEEPKDYPAVAKLLKSAFQDETHSDQNEHLLVERLRNSDAFIPELSIVAELEGKIAGHILLTKIKIWNENESFESLALAPVSVNPNHQKKGIGGQLIRAAHQKAKELGFQSVVLLGHQDYYPKFGYKPAGKYGIKIPFDAPEENCLAIELTKNALKGVSGMVAYPREFYE